MPGSGIFRGGRRRLRNGVAHPLQDDVARLPGMMYAFSEGCRENGRNFKSAATQVSPPLANRRLLFRRCWMPLLVLSKDRLKGALWPKSRGADLFQAGGVPI